jgi:hypothetical protein
MNTQCFWRLLMVAGAVSVARADSAAPVPAIIEPTRVTPLQREAEDPARGRYDWGPAVILHDGLYRMWWTRLGGGNVKRFPYAGNLPDGERFEFTYPDYGDRIYYAESRDGRTWHIEGPDYTGKPEEYGPDSKGPLLVLGPAESSEQRMHLGSPSVIRADGRWYMYYESCPLFILRRGADGRPAVGDEYNNQVFVATSPDGRTWRQHPDPGDPRPILAPPKENRLPGRQRYGFGQASVSYRAGRYTMHYTDSCTGPGDFIVRIEADNPFFRDARVFGRSLASTDPDVRCPAGSVARFAQVDLKFVDGEWLLVRPAYGTGHLGVMVSSDGVFAADARARAPQEVYPQVRTPDPRGPDYLERSSPRFLTDAEGRIIVQDGRIIIYYGSGALSKGKAYTWDLYRCEVPLKALRP